MGDGNGKGRLSRRALLIRTAAAAAFAAALLIAAAATFLLTDPPLPIAPQLGAAIQSSTIRVGDVERSYLAYVPAKLGTNPALLFILHGTRGTGRRMRALTAYEFDVLADDNNFIVVYPDGFKRSWNNCRRAVDKAQAPQVDDVSFIRALIDRFHAHFGVATSHVFAFGFSAGGQMAYRLALEAPEEVAGVGAVAANLPRPEHTACRPIHRPVAVMIVTGTDDPVNPYAGGIVGLFKSGSGMPVLSTLQTATYFSRAAGYSGAPQIQRYPKVDGDEATWVERATWDAASSVEVSLYTVHGGGHTIPQRKYRRRRILGRTNGDIDCMEEFWMFCQRQMRKGPGD